MNGAGPITDTELIFRRLSDAVPAWGLFFPVALAFLVLFLVLFFLQPETVGEMLKRARIPSAVIGLLGLLWTLGLFVYVGLLLAISLGGGQLSLALVLGGGIPLAAFPLLLGLFITAMVLVRNPRTLAAVGIVAAVSIVYLVAGYFFLPVFGWYVLLVPVLLVAVAYAILMYVCDARTIHPVWAAFLGLLRCLVYATLALVFLLPGCQTYQTTETRPKALVLFDVSNSMNLVDDLPTPGQDPRTLLSRQGKVIKMLTDPGPGGRTFMDRLQEKSPLTLYRFGAVLDDVQVQQFFKNQKWGKDQWATWLHPDKNKIDVPMKIGDKELTVEERGKLRLKLENLYDDLTGGTNVSGSALQAAVREAGQQLQAIIIVSDGRSNLGSAETFRELQARAADPKRPFHIITVGVGSYREPVGIRIEDLGAPQQARPDDKFPVRVPVIGDGLRGEPFTVTLEANRVVKKGDRWEPIPGDKFTLVKEGKFDRGEGDHPFGEVEFEIDVRKARGIKEGDTSKDDLVEGTWEFRAKVPRHRLEPFAEAEHVSKRPARVLVQKRKLRVLLFASGPGRDYQFLRTLLYREVQEKRMELSIYLQTAAEKDVDQDVEAQRLLTDFPSRLGADGPKTRPYYSLSDYDVIIAFDPDWSKLDKQQLKLLEQWVGGPSAGGFIYVAGPVNTYQLARSGRAEEMAPILTITPVTVKDSRLLPLGLGRDLRRPYVLHFSPQAREMDFLNLEENPKDPLSGWEKFFWGDAAPPEPGKDIPPRHGFYDYYSVEKVKPDGKVLATFPCPAEERINDGKDEQPFIVTMRYGAGRSVFIGSPELWRLRMYNSTFYQRFWIKLCRYVSSGSLSKLSRYGMIPIPNRAKVGLIKVEAQVLGADLKPLPPDTRPVVKLIRPPSFDPKTDRDTPEEFELKAKPSQGEWQGYFAGTVRINTPGDYTLKIPIPGTSQELDHDLHVYRPDPETEITRPDHGHLYQLATSARPILARLHDKERHELMKLLRAPADEKKSADGQGGKEDKRLYFPLSQAQIIPDLLVKLDPTRESTKGRLQDLWDKGWESGWYLRADWFLMLLVGAVGLLGFAILLFIRRWVLAVVFLAAAGLLVAGVLLLTVVFEPRWADLSLDMAFVLGLVVGLLAVEWLTRKLLKLA
jgi:hypothetical protein